MKKFQRHETYNNYMNLRIETIPQYPRIRHKCTQATSHAMRPRPCCSPCFEG